LTKVGPAESSEAISSDQVCVSISSLLKSPSFSLSRGYCLSPGKISLAELTESSVVSSKRTLFQIFRF
jgi:hypothetical protein